MKLELKLNPTATQNVLAIVIALLTAASVTGSIVDRLPLPPGLRAEARESFVRLFALDCEGNIPTWFSASLLLAAAGLMALVTVLKYRTQDRYRRYWGGLACLLLAASVDEAAVIHEMTIKPMGLVFAQKGFLTFGWIIPGALFVLAIAVLYIGFLWSLPSATRWRFVYAGILYFGGAIGFESISGEFVDLCGLQSPSYLLVSTCEEMLEMLGVVVLIRALLCYLEHDMRAQTARPSTTTNEPSAQL